MGHEIILENSNSAADYTLPNTIMYLKAVKYINRLRQISQRNLELIIRGAKN